MTKTMIPTFRRVGGEADSEAAKWMSSVPDTFNATDAHTATTAALKEARDRVDAIRDKYHGTVPPPPWPADAATVKAIEQMEGAHDFFSRIEATKVPQKWTKTSKAWTALSRAGVELFELLDELDEKSRNAPTLAAMLKAVPDPRTVVLGMPIRTLLIGGAALYFLAPEVRRFVRRTLGLRARRA